MMTALWWIFGVCVYFFIGGIAGRITQVIIAKKDTYLDGYWDTPGPPFATILWPVGVLAIPLFAGHYTGKWLTGAADRRKKKADKATLAHERKMAEIKAQEASWKSAAAYLRSEGVKVDVEP